MSMSHSGNELDTVIENLEEDATGILKFVVSNGLVPNPSKTEFMLLNTKEQTMLKQITVRAAEIEEIQVIGMNLDNDQKCTSH